MIAEQTWYYQNIIISLKFDPAEFSLSIYERDHTINI